MCDSRHSSPSPVAPAPSAASSSSSLSSRSSVSRRSPAERSLLSDTGRGSDSLAAREGTASVPLATAERIYRCLGLAKPARPGDVLLHPGQVSEATIRRWRQLGWVELRQRLFITARGCAALPVRGEVLAFAERRGRSTLFL